MGIIPNPEIKFEPEDFKNTSENYQKKMDKLLEDHPEIAQRALELKAERQILKLLRKSRGLTQKEIAKTLKVTQAQISKLENQTNHRLDTLAKFIEATGGKLEITAIYDDQEIPLPTTFN